jgi:peptide chain release factor 1
MNSKEYFSETIKTYEKFKSNQISNIELEEYILEPGVGGQESKIFSSELIQKYKDIFELLKFKYTSLDENKFSVSGKFVYKYFYLENGVHRVQRVPKTENKGRIHTSVAAVYFLPEIKTEQVKLNEKDVKIDTFRASGAGGQHVNKTDSAVRVTHLPTGITAVCQNGRNQHENKKQALENLKTKIYLVEHQKKMLKQDIKKTLLRTFVFHPKQYVQNELNDKKENNLKKVLNGEIDELMYD